MPVNQKLPELSKFGEFDILFLCLCHHRLFDRGAEFVTVYQIFATLDEL